MSTATQQNSLPPISTMLRTMSSEDQDRKPIIHSTIDTSRGYAATATSSSDRTFTQMPSPDASPTTQSSTRSSSLLGIGLPSATCGSPADLDISTPVSERGIYASSYHHNSRTESSRPYRGSFGHYTQQEFHGLQTTTPHHHIGEGYADRQRNNSEDEKQLSKHEKRRRNHLNSEKRRRENIKGGMDSLVDLVPSCRNIQESKANILRKTKDYIHQLLGANQELRIRLQAYEQEISRLNRICTYNGLDPNAPVHAFHGHRTQI